MLTLKQGQATCVFLGQPSIHFLAITLSFFFLLSFQTCVLDHRIHHMCLFFYLTLFRIGFFRAAHGWGGGGRTKRPPSLKSATHPTMMKLGTVIPCPKKIQKCMNYVTHPLSSADISIFLLEISKFFYVKKYRYRLHFDL